MAALYCLRASRKTYGTDVQRDFMVTVCLSAAVAADWLLIGVERTGE